MVLVMIVSVVPAPNGAIIMGADDGAAIEGQSGLSARRVARRVRNLLEKGRPLDGPHVPHKYLAVPITHRQESHEKVHAEA